MHGEGACVSLKKVQWQPGSLISVGDNSCCCGKKEHGPRNRRIPKAPDRRSSSSSSPTEPAALVRAVCVCACLCVILARKIFFLLFPCCLFLASMMTSMDSEDQSSAASPTDVSHDPGYVFLYFPLTTSVACASGEEGCVCVYTTRF